MGKKPLAPLSDAQQEIMEFVWNRGEVSTAEVREELAKRRTIARNTVQTLMTRMYEKGWLTYRPIGRTFLYSASVLRTTSMGEKAIELIDSTFGGSAEELMTALIEYRGLTTSEAKNIRLMLEAAERTNGTNVEEER